jgi:hypothetical protein
VVLLASSFRPAAIEAARAAAGSAFELATLRFVENGTGASPLLERIGEPGEPPDVPAAAGFRSGLSAADLDLTPEERAEFEERERF